MTIQPALNDANALTYRWEWTLQASPERLWPLVSDTNRMNRLAGMEAVRYENRPGAARIGHGKQLGKPVSWDEHPFKWVYREQFSVLRTFHDGPLEAYRSTVTLSPAGTGTKLTHVVKLVPRTFVAKLIYKLGDARLKAAWEKAYRAVDGFLSVGGDYPFASNSREPLPPKLRAVVDTLAEEGHERALAERLARHVQHEAELELMHVRPFALADRWKVDRGELLELCLRATRHGLLLAQWSHLCPHCRGAVASVADPAGLGRAAHCESCQLDFENASQEAIELSFRPDPALRPVADVAYCVGGPGATPHVVLQDEAAPQETRALALTVPPGQYRVRGAMLGGEVSISYVGNGTGPLGETLVKLSALGFEGGAGAIAGPKLALKLENVDRVPVRFVIERAAWSDDVVSMAFVSELPAFQALNV